MGTTFLRAGFLPEPESTEVRRLLREYVDARLRFVRARDLTGVEQMAELSAAQHRELWAVADAAAEQWPRSVPVGLFIESLNEVIDLHEDRVTTGLRYRIPPSLIWTLYLLAALSMGTMGLHFGLSGTRSILSSLALVASFVAILVLIVDLDSPVQRLFEVSQDPLADTLSTIDAG